MRAKEDTLGLDVAFIPSAPMWAERLCVKLLCLSQRKGSFSGGVLMSKVRSNNAPRQWLLGNPYPLR